MVEAQKWLEENHKDKSITKIVVGRDIELDGKLEIDGYSSLEFILLSSAKLITGITITGCPNIKVFIANDNQITEIKGLDSLPNLQKLNLGENKLERIDISTNILLESLILHGNPKNFKFINGIKDLTKLVSLNSSDTFPIIDLLEQASETDLKEVAGKLGLKTEEGESKDEIKKNIIAEIEKSKQNNEKLSDSETGIPDLLNEKGEIDKDKLGKLKDDAEKGKKYQELLDESANDPIKSEDKKEIDQAKLTEKLKEAAEYEELKKNNQDLFADGKIDQNKINEAKKAADEGKALKLAVEAYFDNSEKIELYDRNTGNSEELTGELTIEDYAKVEEINLKENKIKEIDISLVPNLRKLHLARNPNLVEINGLENSTKLEVVNLLETPGLNEEAAKDQGMVSKEEHEKVKQERDARPDTTLKLGETPEKVEKLIKDSQSNPVTGNSGTGTALTPELQKKLDDYYNKQEKNNSMADIEAQQALQALDTTESTETDKWDGKLVIEGYAELESINLTGNVIDELVIKNCPKLKDINLNDNQFVKIDLSEINPTSTKALKNFFANNNKLEELNLKNCNGLEELEIGKNAGLKKIKGLEEIETINTLGMEGTPVRLVHEDKFGDYQQTKEVVKELLGDLNSARGDDGKIDKGKLQGAITGKASGDSLSSIGGELGLTGNEAKDKDKIIAKIKELKQQVTQAVNDLLNKINNLGLGLSGADITEQKVLNKITELINRPTRDDYNTIKTERDNLKNDTINKTDMVESNKVVFDNLGISFTDYESRVVSVKASEAEKIRNELIEKRFGELSSEKNTAFYLNIGLSILVIGSLAGIIWLLLRENKSKTESEPENEK
nr:2919_t:CDS:2 [Entrophospora candida]